MYNKPPIIVQEIRIIKEKPGGVHWGSRKDVLRDRPYLSKTSTCKNANLYEK